jgi:glycosyltransferase involved in cell wall biosynthesis
MLQHYGGPEIVLTRPPGLARWFARVLKRTAPDVILMNYGHWDYLIPDDARKSILTVIETHDLASVNLQMQRAIQAYLGPQGMPVVLSSRTASDELVREDFFRTRQFPVDARELRTFDRYDHTIAISKQEKQLIEQACPHTRTHFIPMTVRPTSGPSTYSGPPLFPLGPTLFNVQGYLYFVRRVLPVVLKAAPSFRLRVTGRFAWKVTAEAQPGIELCGFVRDFEAISAQSGFLVCPVYGGTGQQVKIVEAMSRGLAVVALRDAAERTPLEHGVSGLVADSADEFAEHVLTLWNDRALCRSLGEAGRRIVEMHLGEERLSASLQAMLP